MQGYYRILLTFLMFLIYASLIQAQDTTITLKIDTISTPRKKTITIVITRTIPKFILHVNGGYNSGAMDLTSHNGGFSRNELVNGVNYGARNGFGFNLIGKLPLGKSGKIWLDAITGFDRFQSNIFASNTEEGKVSYNSINGGLGLEYNLTPSHKVKYYIGANALLSAISGKATLINTQDNNVIDVTIKSSLRLGYSAFVGFEYAFDKNIGLNLGLKFTHANLLLKKSVTGTQSDDGTLFETELNDDPSPNNTDPVLFAGWKQFAYFSGNVGLSYFFGVKEKRYKLPN
jgi:opacity protein-like surface antigen